MSNAVITEESAKKELEKGYERAEKILESSDKLEVFLQKVEKKFKEVPVVGEALSRATVFAEMIKNFATGKYKELPIGSAVAIISALVYFISPIDLVADVLPIVGHSDDAAIILACFKLVNDDVEKYLKWRDENHRTLEA